MEAKRDSLIEVAETTRATSTRRPNEAQWERLRMRPMDDKLQLNIKGGRQSTAGSDKPHEEQQSDAENDRPFTTATPKKTMRELHPQMFPKPRPVIQSLNFSQLDDSILSGEMAQEKLKCDSTQRIAFESWRAISEKLRP